MEISIEKIIEAAKKGGEIHLKYFGESLAVIEKKTAADFRTKADVEAEDIILENLSLAFPDFNIVSEERGRIERNSEYTFLVDPLDGTNNFVLGLPNFTVSIGLLKGDEIIAGVVHAALLNQTYVAEKGKGAFLNGNKICVNKECDITRASISCVVGYTGLDDGYGRMLKKMNDANIKRILLNWAPAFDFCLLASGKIEGIISKEVEEEHDFVAGKLIAKEAGAYITDFEGIEEVNERSDTFIISNGNQIQNELLKIANEK